MYDRRSVADELQKVTSYPAWVARPTLGLESEPAVGTFNEYVEPDLVPDCSELERVIVVQ